MDMNRTFFVRTEDRQPQWRVIDANGKVVGRLATQIATFLRGKDKASFTPHTDNGDYIVVVNAEKLVLTGNKMKGKEYLRHTKWHGGLKSLTAQQIFEKDPTEIIRLAVKRMMPRTKQSDAQMTRLRIFVGDQHPHTAQVSTPVA